MARVIRQKHKNWTTFLFVLLATWAMATSNAEAQFPTVVATNSTSEQTSNSATPTITLPSGIAAGDLVIAFLAQDACACTATWPGSWVELVEQGNGSSNSFHAAYLIASGGETTVVPTLSVAERSQYMSIRISAASWHGVTPPEVAAAVTANSANPNSGSLTPSWGAEDTLWITAFGIDDPDNPVLPVTAWPTNYTDNNLENGTLDASTSGVVIATRELNAATENPGAFTTTANDTWVASTIAVRPAVSDPQILFTTDRDTDNEIYVMDSDGTNLTNLTNNIAAEKNARWSPDGTQIVFVSGRDGNDEIYTMNADGTGQTNRSNNAAKEDSPGWSADGTQIVFRSDRDSGNFEIYTMNADGTGQTNISNHATAKDDKPDWSPDGTQIVFVSDRDGDNEIWVMDANGDNPANLTNNTPFGETTPAWSRDGTQIAFTSDRDGNNEIYVMDADGTNPINRSNNAAKDEEPAWSADGTQIVFVSDRDVDKEIYVMNADGTGQTNLTNNAAKDSGPDYKADPSAFYLQQLHYRWRNDDGGEAGPGWYNTAWTYRKKITVDNTKVDANQTDFPVYVDLADLGADFFANVESSGGDDGGDIRVTTFNGTTELPRQVVGIDVGSETGELHFEADFLSSTVNTDFYIYYGNAAASEPAASAIYGSEKVWENGYAGLWHLKEDQAGIGNPNLYQDSTSNPNDGDDQISATGQGGQVSAGQEFDGTDDYVDAGTDASLDMGSGDFSLSASFQTTTTTGSIIAGKGGDSTGGIRYVLRFHADGGVSVIIDDNVNKGDLSSAVIGYNDGAWHHLAGVRDGTNLRLYVDGTEDTNSPLDISVPAIGSLDSPRVFSIGSIIDEPTVIQSRFFDGLIDEVRVSNVVRPAGWIGTEHNNQLNPGVGGFLATIGGQEAQWFDSAWGYRKKITIDNTKVDADQTDFPVYVDLADLGANFHSNVKSLGEDIRVTRADGVTELPRQVVVIDTGANTGELHFEANFLSSTVDTDFYILTLPPKTSPS